MIEIKTIGIWGSEGAIRGMRMPYESFDKSDSRLTLDCDDCWIGDLEDGCNYCRSYGKSDSYKKFVIGEADMKLCKKLIKSGSEHRKFLRMIHVQAEVNAPRYWWAEMDKYKFVEANSSSTMHLITKRQLTFDDFSYEGDIPEGELSSVISDLNGLIDCYNEQTDKKDKDRYFMRIKQLLPESFMQKRVIDTNYECLLSIYNQRSHHRLSEWSSENGFCNWCLSLPYFKEFIDA